MTFLQSPVNAETGSAHDETSSSGNKEDEDDDDDESDDKIDTQTHDPERLKAFNVSFILISMVISHYQIGFNNYCSLNSNYQIGFNHFFVYCSLDVCEALCG